MVAFFIKNNLNQDDLGMKCCYRNKEKHPRTINKNVVTLRFLFQAEPFERESIVCPILYMTQAILHPIYIYIFLCVYFYLIG